MNTDEKAGGGKMSAHTPTPWHWRPELGNYIVDDDGNAVAEIDCCKGNPADGPFIVEAANEFAALRARAEEAEAARVSLELEISSRAAQFRREDKTLICHPDKAANTIIDLRAEVESLRAEVERLMKERDEVRAKLLEGGK